MVMVRDRQFSVMEAELTDCMTRARLQLSNGTESSQSNSVGAISIWFLYQEKHMPFVVHFKIVRRGYFCFSHRNADVHSDRHANALI